MRRCTFRQVGAALSAAGTRFQCSLGVASLAWLWEHRVSGRAILPGAAMFEAAFAAIKCMTGEAVGLVSL